MSLQTDIAFYHALSTNPQLQKAVEGRIYNTAIPLPDEDADNCPIPYIIITYDGMTNDVTCKDDPYEGESDSVNIGVLATAETRVALADLMQIIRNTIHDYFVENGYDEEIIPSDYQLSATPVQYDSMKPCYWQTLTYQCDTYS